MKGWIARLLGQAPNPKARPTLRLRLALLYGGLVLLAGVVLLGITYTRVAVASQAGVVSIARRGLAVNFASAVPTPGIGPRGTLIRILRASISQQQTQDVHQVFVQGVVALGLVALLALVAGWIVAGRILRPLQIMTNTARKLSAENLGGRIALKGPRDELKNLADTIDALLERLDAAVSTERRFVANVSHELRTPLAVQKAMLEVALSDPAADADSLRELAAKVWQVNQRSRRLIDGLLELSRSQRGVQAAAPVDLASIVREAIETAAPELAALGLRVEQRLQPVTVHGDRVLLERLAGNLIENAARHNVAGGWVTVATGAAGGAGVLEVENTGTVFAQAEVARLFEPFQRGGQERTESSRGAGLGLSIVRAVVQAHEGQIEATARPEGGLLVRVSLPIPWKPS